jgi:type II secretory pathway pseudopilin PulG
MKRKLSATAFSLVELMGVLAIVGLLAAIVLPRVTGSDEQSKIAACKAHKCNIEVQAELWLQNKGSWPATNLSNISVDVNYFPQGIPICPVDGSSYTFDPTTGRVSGHTH